MTARPILFSSPMVKALLAGTKTQTRRALKPQPEITEGGWLSWRDGECAIDCFAGAVVDDCPYGKPGDLLWVRESWQHAPQTHCSCPQGSEPSPCDDWSEGTGCRSNRGDVLYRADVGDEREEASVVRLARKHGTRVIPWRPSIFMPRWASRLTLRIGEVRVERLQDISSDDCIAEGIDPFQSDSASEEAAFNRSAYAELWESINGKGSWDANPWCWRIAFEVIRANVDDVLAKEAA